MTLELRPMGVACNLACRYCYQNPQREAGNQRRPYNLEKIKAEAERIGGSFTLFGGEPLLMPFDDLEHLFSWGLTAFGGSGIQTNGVLIEDRHIDLFRRCKVSVGISIDGPGALNDARWNGGADKTRQATARVEAVIARLCREYQPPGLIVTLHKGNAAPDMLPQLADWMRGLAALGIKSVRLHLLEVDHGTVRDQLALTPRENVEALLALARIEDDLGGMRFDLFREMERLLFGEDGGATCTWRGCDSYTTDAVQGLEGNGQSSNCGRTDKEGIGFIKSDTAGFERYVALSRTPQAENGCAGCRFFLMCKGHCPGTAVDGDWRNRTEDCAVWKHLFALIEQRLVVSGQVPLTLQPLRFELERQMVHAWERGRNPSLNRTLASLRRHGVTTGGPSPVRPAPIRVAARPRISWVGESARERWQPRLERLRTALEDMTVLAGSDATERCAVRLVPGASFHRLIGLASRQGRGAAILPDHALPRGVLTVPGAGKAGVLITGAPAAVTAAQAAWKGGRIAEFRNLLDLPACCLSSRDSPQDGDEDPLWAGAVTMSAASHSGSWPPDLVRLPESLAVHALLAPLGLSVLPVVPCRLDCPEAHAAALSRLDAATGCGYAEEVEWLRECLSWAVDWSALNGIVEVKTPLFKFCTWTIPQAGTTPQTSRRRIIREGRSAVDGGGVGLSFPFAQSPRPRKVWSDPQS